MNMKKRDRDLARRQMLVGRAKKLYDDGKNSVEIAQTLGISESSARSLIRIVNDADKMREVNKDE